MKKENDYSYTYKCKCINKSCKDYNKESLVSSEEPPFDFIVCKELMVDGIKNSFKPVKFVCNSCFFLKEIEENSKEVKKEGKYRVYTKKQGVNRTNNFFRKYEKESNFQPDPEVGKDATSLSKKEMENISKRLNNLK